MKSKSIYDIGDRVIVMFPSTVEKYLRTLSKNTFITNFPDDFIDLVNDNYDASLHCIRYAPAIYFKLCKKFQNDNLIKKNTIASYKRHNKFNEIYIKDNEIYLKKVRAC